MAVCLCASFIVLRYRYDLCRTGMQHHQRRLREMRSAIKSGRARGAGESLGCYPSWTRMNWRISIGDLHRSSRDCYE